MSVWQCGNVLQHALWLQARSAICALRLGARGYVTSFILNRITLFQQKRDRCIKYRVVNAGLCCSMPVLLCTVKARPMHQISPRSWVSVYRARACGSAPGASADSMSEHVFRNLNGDLCEAGECGFPQLSCLVVHMRVATACVPRIRCCV